MSKTNVKDALLMLEYYDKENVEYVNGRKIKTSNYNSHQVKILEDWLYKEVEKYK